MAEPTPDLDKMTQLRLKISDLEKAVSEVSQNRFFDSTEATLSQYLPKEKVDKIKGKTRQARLKELEGEAPPAETPIGQFQRKSQAAVQTIIESLKDEDPGWFKRLFLGGTDLAFQIAQTPVLAATAPERVAGLIASAADAKVREAETGVESQNIDSILKAGWEFGESMLRPITHPVETFVEDPAISIATGLGLVAGAASLRAKQAGMKAQRAGMVSEIEAGEAARAKVMEARIQRRLVESKARQAELPKGERRIIPKDLRGLDEAERASIQAQIEIRREIRQRKLPDVRRVVFDPETFAANPIDELSKTVQEQVEPRLRPAAVSLELSEAASAERVKLNKAIQDTIRERLYGKQPEQVPVDPVQAKIEKSPEAVILERTFGLDEASRIMRENPPLSVVLRESFETALEAAKQSPAVQVTKEIVAEFEVAEAAIAKSRQKAIVTATKEQPKQKPLLAAEEVLEGLRKPLTEREVSRYNKEQAKELSRAFEEAKLDPRQVEEMVKDPVGTVTVERAKSTAAGVETPVPYAVPLYSEAARPLPGITQRIHKAVVSRMRDLQQSPVGARFVGMLNRYYAQQRMAHAKVSGIIRSMRGNRIERMLGRDWTENDSLVATAMSEGRNYRMVWSDQTGWEKFPLPKADHPDLVQRGVNMWKVLRREARERAVATGLDPGFIDNFFPRSWRKDLKNNQRWRDYMVDQIQKSSKEPMSRAKAEAILNDNILRQRERIASHLEMSREVDALGYVDNDFIGQIRNYLIQTEERILQAKLFGKKDQLLKEMVDGIKNSHPDPNGWKVADRVADSMLRRLPLEEILGKNHKLLSEVMGFNSFVMLGMTTGLMQTSQAVFMAGAGGLTRFLRTLPKGKAIVKAAREHGMLMDELSAPLSIEASDAIFRMSTGVLKNAGTRASRLTYNITGIRWIDAYLRGMGIIIGKEKGVELIEALKRKSPRSQAIRNELQEFGVNVERVLKEKTIPDDELNIYARHWSARANTELTPLTLPDAWQSSNARLFMQYKGFVFNAQRNFKEIMRSKLKTEGSLPMMQSAGTFLVGGHLWAEWQRKMQEVLNGREPQEMELAEAILDDLAMLGILGLSEAALRPARRFGQGAPIAESILPPVFGAAQKVERGIRRTAEEGPQELLDIPAFTRQIKNLAEDE